MNDAIVLLALSQFVCLGGLAYLYLQLQKLRTGDLQNRAPRPQERVHRSARPATPAAPLGRPSAPMARPAAAMTAPPPPPASNAPVNAAALAADLAARGLDIGALARRMNRSEEEVRLLLRRQRAAR